MPSWSLPHDPTSAPLARRAVRADLQARALPAPARLGRGAAARPDGRRAVDTLPARHDAESAQAM